MTPTVTVETAHVPVAQLAPSTILDGSRSSAGSLLPQQIGRFQVRGELGRGAIWVVYRAYDPQLDREVALKVPHPATLENPRARERFLREAKTAAGSVGGPSWKR